MDKFDYLQAALKDPWVRAYLKTIQHNEGTDRGGRGYATYFRYYDNGETPEETLRSYHLHWMPIGNGKFSSASGAYQIINKTYRGVQDLFTKTGVFKRMGERPDSWSPAVQDMMAVELLNESGILKRLLAHDPGVITAGNKTWASFGVKSPQSTAAAFNHYLQQEGQSPVTVKINGQNFNGSGLSYAGGAPAGGSSSSGGVSGVTGRQRTVDTGIDWGSVHASGNGGQGLALADDSGFSLLGRSPTRLDYFGGYHPRSTNTHIDMRPQDTLETAGVNTQYTRDSRPQLQPVPFGAANLILSPETDISDSEKGVANRAFMINQAVNPAPNTTYGASFTGSGIRPTATQYDPETGRVIRNVTLVRDSEYAPDSGETPTADGQSPAGYAADVSPESEFDNTEFMVMPIDDYLARESSEHRDVDRLGTRVDRRIQDMVRNIRVDV